MKIYIHESREDVWVDAYFPKGARIDPGTADGSILPTDGAMRLADGAIRPGGGAILPDDRAMLHDEGPILPANESMQRPDAGALLPAALICPGGGYRVLGTTEGRPVSDKFTDAGFAAFILHYSVGEEAASGFEGWEGFSPVRDLIAAMRLLKDGAAGYGIDRDRIALAGFSAGGHLCAGACYSGALVKEGLLPKALILTYPMGGGADSGGAGRPQPDFDIARMPYADDPAVKNLPTFMWHAKDDATVPFGASERLDRRLKDEGMPHAFLVYEHGIHARPFLDPGWFDKALVWFSGL